MTVAVAAAPRRWLQLTALAPVITIVLSLALYGRMPLAPQAVGMVLRRRC